MSLGYGVVYLLIPTSNHNSTVTIVVRPLVVYLLIPTSNHNYISYIDLSGWVVYLLIPTSNHNYKHIYQYRAVLYIF